MSSCCRFLWFEGFTTAVRWFRILKTIGHLLVPLSSWGEKCPMAPMITWTEEEDDTIRQDAITMTSRRVRWAHGLNAKTQHRVVFGEFFDMPKILASPTKLLPKPEKVHWRQYDGLSCPHEWPDVFTIKAEIENFNIRVSILCQLRQYVTLALW